jgi:hypothetical protein
LKCLFSLLALTDSGGLITLGLFHREWEVQDCIQKFDTMARKIFPTALKSKHKVTLTMAKLLKCWYMDGTYSAGAWEDILQDAFGANTPLFGCSGAGKKVSVVATDISAATRTFSNFTERPTFKNSQKVHNGQPINSGRRSSVPSQCVTYQIKRLYAGTSCRP